MKNTTKCVQTNFSLVHLRELQLALVHPERRSRRQNLFEIYAEFVLVID